MEGMYVNVNVHVFTGTRETIMEYWSEVGKHPAQPFGRFCVEKESIKS